MHKQFSIFTWFFAIIGCTPQKTRLHSVSTVSWCSSHLTLNNSNFTVPIFFFNQGFLSQTLTSHRTTVEGRGPSFLLFYSTTSARSRTLRHLFATMHVRWLSRIFNRNACVYQLATWWDLPPYRISIWKIDWWCNVCLFTWWIVSRFCYSDFDIGNLWIWTRIDYHPCITSGPTNQVC